MKFQGIDPWVHVSQIKTYTTIPADRRTFIPIGDPKLMIFRHSGALTI